MQLPFFYEPDLTENSSLITLSSETCKHAIQVLRLKQGNAIHLTNGKGLLSRAVIISSDKKQATAQIESVQFFNKNNNSVSIAISLLKNTNRLEWFLEKATELGIAEIILLQCTRTEKQHFKIDRVITILISAMLQSKQVWLPKLISPTNFASVVEQANYNLKLIAHCGIEEKTSLHKLATKENTIILIGPEGDFSEEEILLAEKNNFTAVSLGNNRLRTETAGITAAVILTLNN